MSKFTVFNFTFAGYCTVHTVEASDKFDAKFKALMALPAASRNDIQRQVAEKV